MKIVVAVRTRNEERNIANFCQGYGFADLILVADGGSEDNTVEIAQGFPNVAVRNFPVKLFRAGTWINPEVEHYNFLFDRALSENPDWIITDDCDCRPNKLLRENARTFLETTEFSLAFTCRLYIWARDNLRDREGARYFPAMTRLGRHGAWEPRIWAFKRDIPIRPNENDPWEHFRGWAIPDIPRLDILPPYCLLHFSWPDEAEVRRKQEFGQQTGWTANMLHPLFFGGPLKDCPDWAIE